MEKSFFARAAMAGLACVSAVHAGSVTDDSGSPLPADAEGILVTASPAEYGTPSPAYGCWPDVVAGTPYVFNAPAAFSNVTTGIAAACRGWSLADTNGNAWAGTTLSKTIVYSTPVTLTWLLDVTYKITVNAKFGEMVETSAVWCVSSANGSVRVSAPAEPAAGCAFSHWEGAGVTEANRHANPLALKGSGAQTLVAVFYPARYVKPAGLGGNDEEAGTSWDTAWATPQKAVDHFAGTPGVVRLGAGTFTGPQPLLNVTNAVVVRGEGAGDTILWPDNSVSGATVIENHGTSAITGVTITGNTQSRALQFGANGGRVADSEITANTAGGVSFPSGSKGAAARCVISRNRVSGNGGGVYFGNNPDTSVVENCLIVSNTATGSGNTSGGGGVYASAFARLRYCTVTDNYSPNGGGLACYYVLGNRFVVQNCIVRGNTCAPTSSTADFAGGYYGLSSAFSIRNTATVNGYGTNPLTGDVAFAEASAGDYRIRFSSVCRDAGYLIAADDVFAADLAGLLRVAGNLPDAGCYEYTRGERTVCDISPSKADVQNGDSVTFTGFVDPIMAGSAYNYYWTLYDAAGTAVATSTENPFAYEIDGYGYFTAALSVTNRDDSSDFAACILSRAVYSLPSTNYVVPASVPGAGDGTWPYASWSTATTNIADALGAVASGGAVVVSNGTYQLAKKIDLVQAATLYGAGGPDATILRHDTGCGKDRVLFISHPEARVEGFTLTGGNAFDNWTYGYVVKIAELGGTLTDCRVTGNATGEYGGGAVYVNSADGRVTRCLIANNRYTGTYSFYGGGVRIDAGTLVNCLVTNNTSWHQGGGVHVGGTKARVLNCTIAKNHSRNTACGGVYFNATPTAGTFLFQNNIVVGNTCPETKLSGTGPEWTTSLADAPALSALSNAVVRCTFGRDYAYPLGQTCVDEDPTYNDEPAGDLSLHARSGLIDAGETYDGISDADCAGNPRVSGSQPDVGCYEYDLSVVACSFGVSQTPALAGTPVTFSATVTGAGADDEFGYAWIITSDDPEFVPVTGTGACYTNASLVPGWYTARLDVTNLTQSVPVPPKTIAHCLRIGAHTNYVVTAESYTGGAQWPFDTWAKATTNLFAALDEAIPGAVVCLTNGTHSATGTVYVAKAVTLAGFGGWRETTLRHLAALNTARVAVINHAGARVEGLTLTGGNYAVIWGDGFAVQIGASGGTLADCRVSNNVTVQNGLSCAVSILNDPNLVNRGVITGCIIDNNRCSGSDYYMTGGGLYLAGGVVENTLIYGNKGSYSGGILLYGAATMRNCSVVGNIATTASSGAGLYFKTAAAAVANVLFAGNTNRASSALIDVSADSSYAAAATNAFTHGLFEGQGALGTAPVRGAARFLKLTGDPGTSDFRLVRRTPGSNAGLYDSSWMDEATDLYGRPRVKHYRGGQGIVDIGSCEGDWISPSTLVILR